MSNNHQDKESLLQDEALINSLYEEVNDNETPSTELDQRILAAAHQAVSAKPQLVKSKRPAWVMPIASAASLVLVISVVTSLGVKKPADSYISHADQDVFQPANEQTNSSSSLNDTTSTKLKKQEKVVTEMFAAAPIQSKRALTNKSVSSSKTAEKNTKARFAATTMNADVTQENNRILDDESRGAVDIAESEFNQAALLSLKATPKEASEENRISGLVRDAGQNATYTRLTIKQFLNYQQQQKQWQLVQENNDYYIAIVLLDNNANEVYQLDKSLFTAKKQTKLNDTERVNVDITLIAN